MADADAAAPGFTVQPARWAVVRLVRPGNLAMTGLAVATGAILATTDPAMRPVAMASASAVLVAAFGNLLNDLLDAELDRRAHPERLLASGRLGRRPALALSLACLAAGIGLALAVDWRLGLFAAANGGLLALYEARLKAAGLPGNLLVGALVGSAFLFGGVAATGTLPHAPMLLLLATVAALTNVARELLKDIEDAGADAGHRRTFPLRHGFGPTRLLSLALVNAAVLATLAAFFAGPASWWWPWLVVLAAADTLFVVAACLAWVDDGVAQRLLKLAMLIALAAFVSGPSLA